MNVCGKCEQEILISADPVACSGKCGAVFHRTCTALTKTAAKLVVDQRNMQFKCDECLDCDVGGGQSDLLSEVGVIRREVHSSILNSIPDIKESLTAQVNEAIKKGLEELMESCMEMFKDKINSFLECSVAEKLEKVMKSNLEKNLNERKENKNNRKRGKTHSETDVLPGSKHRKVATGNSEQMQVDGEDEVFEKDTYAKILKGTVEKENNKNNNKKMKDRKLRPVIVIKPNENNQTNDETRTFIKSNLDPKIHKIRNFRNGKDGSIILECATSEVVSKVKSDIEGKFGQKYTSTVPAALPRLKIVGMSEKYSEEDFIEQLTSQNDEIFIEHVKVISSYENPHFKYNKYSVIIEVNYDTFDALMMAEKVNVGWDRCPVYEAVKILRCFKCGEFGHMSTNCENPEKCSKCSEPHKTSECTSTVLKCVNCLKKNTEQKMNLEVDHAAFSSRCSVFKHLVAVKKDRMYTDE